MSYLDETIYGINSKDLENNELLLDEADKVALKDNKRFNHKEVFTNLLKKPNRLYGISEEQISDDIFEKLESFRRKKTQLDYEKELESYREEKYNTTNIS